MGTQNTRSEWIWSAEWYWPGMSMMGCALRAADANCLNERTLYQSLKLQQSDSSVAARSLIASRFTSPYARQLAAKLGLTAIQYEQSTLEKVMAHLAWVPLLHDTFRYCPTCLAVGYHATYFQIGALRECPLHRIPLQNNCPCCSRRLPVIKLCVGWFDQPFYCPFCAGPLAPLSPKIANYFGSDHLLKKWGEIWKPLDHWLALVLDQNCAFSYLREWALSYRYSNIDEPQVLSFNALQAIVPLDSPMLNFKSMPFEAIALGDMNLYPYEAKTISAPLALDAYLTVRERIEIDELSDRPERLPYQTEHLHLPTNLPVNDLAYIWWRSFLEGKESRGLMEDKTPLHTLHLPKTFLPNMWSRIPERLWELIFYKLYLSARELILEKQHAQVNLKQENINRYMVYVPSCFSCTGINMPGLFLGLSHRFQRHPENLAL